jgi:predicted HTH transcriptional regulator
MFETTDELLKQILLSEASSLVLMDLKYKGNQVHDPHSNSLADELAAMANTANGVFVLGVDDKSRSVIDLPLDKLAVVEAWLRGICNDLITPQLFCRIRKIPVVIDDGVERVIIRVDVPKSLSVHQSPSGYFHRLRSSKRQMAPDVLARLFQQRSQARMIRFDELSVTTAPRDCLDKTLWEKFKTPLSSDSDEEFLFKLKLLTQDDDGQVCPSVGGILMACKQPHEFLTNAFIQAVVYRGTEPNAAYQIEVKDIVGPLDVQIVEAYKFVEKNMKVFSIKKPTRPDLPQYAMPAIFQALVNAVGHRLFNS